MQIGNRKIVIEIGFGDKGIKQVERSLGKSKGIYGLVISKSELSLHNNIVKVPLDYFLLM